VRFKLICIQIVNFLIDGSIDYEKIVKLTSDAGLDESDVKACIAALEYIIEHGAKYEVDDATLSNELQQLGLPKEHCDALGRPYRENLEKIRKHLADSVFKYPRLANFNWRVDFILSTNTLKECNSSSVMVSMDIENPQNNGAIERSSFEISAEKFRVLFAELNQARAIVETL